MAQSQGHYLETLSKSIKAGFSTIFNPAAHRYYILEHKVNSKYHKAGDTQEIIVDNIEIGRDPKCQVRFDESFTTVSRRHACIVKEGDVWRLIRLSKTNKVLLNGESVISQVLNNGDEIQLSMSGPILGFIVPEGKKSTLNSLALTRRFDLFRDQVLRPYRMMLTVLTAVLLLCVAVGGYVIYSQTKHIGKQDILIDKLNTKLVLFNTDFANLNKKNEERRVQDSIEYANELEKQRVQFDKEIKRQQEITRDAINRIKRGANISALFQESSVDNDVFFITTEKVVMLIDDEEYELKDAGWQATGFLLNDGRFVTARHCVEGWLYNVSYDSESELAYASRAAAEYDNVRIKAYLKAVSTNKKKTFNFTSDDFVIDRSKDRIEQIGVNDEGEPLYWRFAYPANAAEWPAEMWSTDWAYTTKTNGAKGKLKSDVKLSRSLLPLQQLLVLGFPNGIGVEDGNNVIDPISYELKTSRKGLAKNGCILHSRGTDHGNSGGPIFAVDDNGELTVVGIVSRGDQRSDEYNWAVPICHMYEK